MPTATHTTDGLEATLDQMKGLREQFLTAGRKAGIFYLDAYEKAVDRAIDFERTVAGLSQQEWLESLIRDHADATHELSETYTSTLRGLLK